MSAVLTIINITMKPWMKVYGYEWTSKLHIQMSKSSTVTFHRKKKKKSSL